MQAINVLDHPAQRIVEGTIGMEVAIVLAQVLAAGGAKRGYIPLYIAALAFVAGGKSGFYLRFWCNSHNQWHGGEAIDMAMEAIRFLVEGLINAEVTVEMTDRPVGRS